MGRISLFIWMILYTAAAAQVFEIPDSVFQTYRIERQNTFAHMGNGTLLPFRSCYIIWVEPKFEKIIFNKSDSTLYLFGTVHDGARLRDPYVTNTEIMVGKFKETMTDSVVSYSFERKEVHKLGESYYINVIIKITPEDEICFAMSEEEELDLNTLYKENNFRKIMILGLVEIYKAGKLFSDYRY